MTTDDTDELRIRVRRERSTAVVAIVGELDVVTAPRLAGMVDDALLDGSDEQEAPAQVVLDLADVPFVDSAGLSGLVAIHERLGLRSIPVTARNVRPTIRRLFEICGIDQLIAVEHD